MINTSNLTSMYNMQHINQLINPAFNMTQLQPKWAIRKHKDVPSEYSRSWEIYVTNNLSFSCNFENGLNWPHMLSNERQSSWPYTHTHTFPTLLPPCWFQQHVRKDALRLCRVDRNQLIKVSITRLLFLGGESLLWLVCVCVCVCVYGFVFW